MSSRACFKNTVVVACGVFVLVMKDVGFGTVRVKDSNSGKVTNITPL